MSKIARFTPALRSLQGVQGISCSNSSLSKISALIFGQIFTNKLKKCQAAELYLKLWSLQHQLVQQLCDAILRRLRKSQQRLNLVLCLMKIVSSEIFMADMIGDWREPLLAVTGTKLKKLCVKVSSKNSEGRFRKNYIVCFWFDFKGLNGFWMRSKRLDYVDVVVQASPLDWSGASWTSLEMADLNTWSSTLTRVNLALAKIVKSSDMILTSYWKDV